MGELRENNAVVKRPVLVALAGVVAFAAVFLGLTFGLGALSDSLRAEEVTISKVSMTSPSYILLIGSDSRKGTALYTGNPREHGQVKEHADVLTLLRVDPSTYSLTLVTIPSDTVIVGEDMRVGSYLNEEGPDKVIEAAERLTGVHIDYYVLASFTGFEGCVDSAAGVVVDVPVRAKMNDPSTAAEVSVQAGPQQKLSGREALAVACEVGAYGQHADEQRQETVRHIEEALIRKALGSKSELDVEKLLRAISENCETNIDLPTAGALIMDFARHADKVTLYSCAGPYEGSVNAATGDWEVADNPAVWRELMLAVGSGQDPGQAAE